MIETLLALSLLATSATKLRDRATLGPGEIPLILWLLLATIMVGFAYRRGQQRQLQMKPWVAFLALSNILLICGSLTERPTEATSSASPLKGLLAIDLALVGPLLLAHLPSPTDRFKRLGSAWLGFGGLGFGLFYLGSLGPEGWHQFLTFDHGSRFCALSANPNQTALFLALLPLLAINRSGPLLRRISGCLAILWIGLACGSDALVSAWLIGGIVSWAACPRSLTGPCFLLALALSTSLWWAHLGPQPPSQAFWHLDSTKNDVSIRKNLATHGIEAVVQSPYVGWGPGAYSGDNGPFENFEAHNSWIDWASNTGIPGLLGYIALVIWWGRRIWAGERAHLGMFATLLVFSTFHFTFRQPIFWFSWLMCSGDKQN